MASSVKWLAKRAPSPDFRRPREVVQQAREFIAGHVASPVLADWLAQAYGADPITFENLQRLSE
jgi:hypothetical protein